MTQQDLSLDDMMDMDGLEDQTQEVSHGDFDNRPPEGVTVGRLISYIELGKHDGGSYQGKKKPDADKVRLEFELLGPDNIIQFEKDGVTKEFGQIVAVTLKKSLSDKAGFKKLFKKLNYGREDKGHMIKMLGEAFIITVYHNKVQKDGKEVVYVNLHKDGEWGISAPFQVDPITKQKKFYDIRPQTQPLRWFLWDRPQHSNWDALFIDGTRERKTKDAAGVEVVENISKNWLQEMILSAKNYNGSKLQQLLAGVANLPTTEAQAAEQKQETAPAVAQAQVQAEQPNVLDAATIAATAAAATADPLAALGFK
ncbi:hypothetical protein [Rhizobium phage RHEph15]|uniref:Uncharacterized protein n=1 Tax=Rhizobium phage RHph_TM34 TaxID=2509556 RepID=A0A7S5URK9_9CAUD|nr:hypothetical protein EVB35_023 [Rhizobium phage RHph_TM34]QXV74284.1 hypothetical protein [Rhizobium phage RHEph15]QXV74978.1 hypothetical protein [Rhizobium phage RHEph27]